MKPSVLLVDDSPDDIFLFGVALEMSGVEAELKAVTSGEEAYEYLSDASPDLVLIDLNMPLFDGFSLLTALRDRTPALALVVLTSSASERDRRRALELGASGFASKPLELPALARLIGELLAPFEARQSHEGAVSSSRLQ